MLVPQNASSHIVPAIARTVRTPLAQSTCDFLPEKQNKCLAAFQRQITSCEWGPSTTQQITTKHNGNESFLYRLVALAVWPEVALSHCLEKWVHHVALTE